MSVVIHHSRIFLISLFLASLLMLQSVAHAENTHQPFLWTAQGPSNTVYIVGSIHALAPSDFPLAEPYQKAYDDAEITVFEIDLSPETIVRLQELTFDLGTFKDGVTLESALGKERFEKLYQIGLGHGFSLKLMNTLEPWLVSLSLAQIMLVQAGLSPEYGVDKHFQDRATKDGKGIRGLETIEEQLGFFDNMDINKQFVMLEEALTDLEKGEEILKGMIAAWRAGDADGLAKLMNEELRSDEELAEILLTRRNKNWAKVIDTYFTGEDDYLIIVGAGHLVGPDNVIQLLQKKGHSFTRAN